MSHVCQMVYFHTFSTFLRLFHHYKVLHVNSARKEELRVRTKGFKTLGKIFLSIYHIKIYEEGTSVIENRVESFNTVAKNIETRLPRICFQLSSTLL
jgi:hypothetical protein